MTSYFDQAHRDARDLFERAQKTHYGAYEFDLMKKLQELEDRVVFDCKLVAALPMMPAKMRDMILRTIAAHAAQPILYVDRRGEDDDLTIKRYHDLVWELHSAFHLVGKQEEVDGWRWTDNPQSLIRSWAERHDDRMIEIMRENPDVADFRDALATHDARCAAARAFLEAP